MRIGGFLFVWSLLAATIAALSLGPSFAHVLESAPRLGVWSPQLWRETTVFNGQFRLFAVVGAPIDIAAILCPALLAYLLWPDRLASGYAMAATALFAFALAVWALRVAPANSVLAIWQPGQPIAADFNAIRWRWESGHMAVAALKFIGFVALMLSIVSIRRA